ncbi:acyltransferase [Microbacterium aoyamense]|uniref:Acyltransferase n=1 Tax=Microbacterium aoyamense TaxID=344166 RepID=A0ABP5B1X4_9MICO|nr:acyltransferase [Microbacterium aoyamense]
MSTPRTSADSPAVARQPSLDVLRILAVLGVVAIHVFGAIVTNDAVRGGKTWWTAVAIDLGFVWVVPAFVMVSGALVLAPRLQAAGPGQFYRRRVLRLGPAVVFWPIFYILVVRIILSGHDLGPTQIAALLLQGHPYTHLYFLWLIVGLYVVAPVLAAFLAQGGQRRALIFAGVVLAASVLAYSTSGLLALAGQPRPIALNAFTQWVPYVGYFLAGWALKDVVLRRRGVVIAALVAVLCLAEVVVQYGLTPAFPLLRAVAPAGYLGPFTAIATLCIFVVVRSALAAWTPRPRTSRFLQTISDAAFGVFLVHFAFIVVLRMVFPAFAEAASSTLWGAGAMWAAVVVLSFVVTVLARRVPFVRRVF